MPGPLRLSPRLAEARARFDEGRPETALLLAEKVLASYPADIDALYLRFRALDKMGDRTRALAALGEYLSHRKAATAEATLAERLIEDGLSGEAEALLRARLAKGEQFSARFTLAKLLLLEGRVLEAGEELKRLDEIGETAKKSPLLRADYIRALRYAILGDLAGIEEILTRLRKGGIRAHRLRYFEILRDLLATGDLDAFAARRAEIRAEVERHPFYAPLYRDLRPEIFLPGGRLRLEARRVLGERVPGPEIEGADLLDEEEATMLPLLFDKTRRIRLERLDLGPDEGRSGDRVLRAFPEGAHLRYTSSLLKIGPKHRILVEREKIGRFVQEVLHIRHHPSLLGATWTLRRGALRFSWGVADHEAPRSLRAIYLDETAEAFGRVLDSLFGEALAPWHATNAAPQAIDLSPLAKRTADLLEGAAAHLPDAGEIPSPIESFRRLSRILPRRVPVLSGIRHGDLNMRNILVPPSLQPVLIDFYKTSPGPVWEDFARLEADLRYEVDPPTEAYAPEFRWMDESFLREEDLGADLHLDYRRSLEKRFLAIRRIRSWAARAGGETPPVVYGLFLATAVARHLGYGRWGEAARRQALFELHKIYEVTLKFFLSYAKRNKA